jgi:hypothetical protein
MIPLSAGVVVVAGTVVGGIVVVEGTDVGTVVVAEGTVPPLIGSAATIIQSCTILVLLKVPVASFTVRETVNEPGFVQVWEGFCSVDVAPSPKSHSHDAALVDRSSNHAENGANPWLNESCTTKSADGWSAADPIPTSPVITRMTTSRNEIREPYIIGGRKTCGIFGNVFNPIVIEQPGDNSRLRYPGLPPTTLFYVLPGKILDTKVFTGGYP